MFELSLTPLTDVEFWQLVGVGIMVMGLSAVCMVGLWVAFGPEPYRENRRLSRIQHTVQWLAKYGKAWRVL